MTVNVDEASDEGYMAFYDGSMGPPAHWPTCARAAWQKGFQDAATFEAEAEDLDSLEAVD